MSGDFLETKVVNIGCLILILFKVESIRFLFIAHISRHARFEVVILIEVLLSWRDSIADDKEADEAEEAAPSEDVLRLQLEGNILLEVVDVLLHGDVG